MNLILLFDNDFVAGTGRVRLTGRRHKHVMDIHRAKAGDVLTVGLLGGRIGIGRVVALTDGALEMDVQWTVDPPEALPLTLILALPRPQVIKRVLIAAASLGVKKIIFLNFSRVEKSLWKSSSLRPEAVREQLILGLEQGKDTVLPEVLLRPRFKPFVEDELPGLIRGTRALVAHPGLAESCPSGVTGPVTLVIGPEGGILDYELEKFLALGFQGVHLGARILRVETAVPFVIARLF